VLFNPDTGETRAMRTKEDAADYRYFPDPDLPPLVIAPEWVEQVKAEMPELPRAMAARFVAQYGLPEYDATTLTQSQAMAPTLKPPPRPAASPSWQQLGDGRDLAPPEHRGDRHGPVKVSASSWAP
jgi:aspartyl-tRNA(Asn)/glutamyl-tRNA(Gln) amidotransferase subunit B